MVDNKSQTLITDTVKYRNETDTILAMRFKKKLQLSQRDRAMLLEFLNTSLSHSRSLEVIRNA